MTQKKTSSKNTASTPKTVSPKAQQSGPHHVREIPGKNGATLVYRTLNLGRSSAKYDNDHVSIYNDKKECVYTIMKEEVSGITTSSNNKPQKNVAPHNRMVITLENEKLGFLKTYTDTIHDAFKVLSKEYSEDYRNVAIVDMTGKDTVLQRFHNEQAISIGKKAIKLTV